MVITAPPTPVVEQGLMRVARTGITFRDIAPGRVMIEVAVRNKGAMTSRGGLMRIEAAPLGAFVPWSPLTEVRVPPVGAGESVLARTVVHRAVAGGLTERGFPRAEEAARASLVAWAEAAVARGIPGTARRLLPRDSFETMRRRNVHWAGNLKVFFREIAVERHMARAVRIYPGRTNLATFYVGSGPDAYNFSISCERDDWETHLWEGPVRVRLATSPEIPQGRWWDIPGTTVVMLGLTPPDGCSQGDVEVHVTQRSSERTAVVEFSFDPEGLGTGCYVVG